ncbi:conserved hypothetical protein [Agrobacterium tumefaciens str. CFBP 5621]|nr:conserved hypothetical protein [Agrobacterium tumefaciens str. CFBP 5621]
MLGVTEGIFRNASDRFLVALLFRSDNHSTVTDFARLRGWSTSVPMKTAV